MERETTRAFPLLLLLFLILLSSGTLRAWNWEVEQSNAAGPITGLADTLYLQLNDCSAEASVCLAIPQADSSDYTFERNGIPYTGPFEGCNEEIFHQYNYQALPGSGGIGAYVLQSWGIGGSIFSAPFNTMQDLVDSMNVWDPLGGWTLDAANFTIYGGDPSEVYSGLQVWHPSILTPLVLDRMDYPIAQGTRFDFTYGSHELIVVETATAARDTVQIYVSCTISETIPIEVTWMESDTFCLDFSELLLPIIMVSNDCPSASGTEADFQLIQNDSCLQITGLNPGTDSACILACDLTGHCDTTWLIATTVVDYQVGVHDLYDTLQIGESKTHCLDQSVFGGMAAATITDLCPTDWGSTANLSIDPLNYCITYTGLNGPATEDFCIEMCDINGVCDTSYFHVWVKDQAPLVVRDTILRNTTKVFCALKSDNLQTAPMSLTDACSGASPEPVRYDLDLNTYCVSYSGKEAGLGEACLYLRDSVGNVDTTYLKVLVREPSMAIESLVLEPGDSLTYCIDTLELAGRLQSVTSICSGAGLIDYLLDEDALCLEIVALESGQDSLCYVFCDDTGLCDTIRWRIKVLPENLVRPQAIEDFASITEGELVQINLCSNDSLFGAGNSSWKLLEEPRFFGTASLAEDACELTYQSTGGGCSKIEILRYELCNAVACDTSFVYIKINCTAPPLQIYSAFSPNGDNRNDVFRIDGLERYPDHRLTIYNRWGLMLYQIQDYQNDWRGTWDEKPLPDGTYFYLFEDGMGEQRTGTLVIHR